MEFGDKEWFKNLEEAGIFPSDYAFYVDTDRLISAICLNSNVRNVGNIKHRILNNWSNQALVDVVNCKTSKDYYEKFMELQERWS